MEQEFTVDYTTQNEIKDALEIAICYCEENIPKADGWSKRNLETQLGIIKTLQENIGNSFVVGYYK